MNTVLTYLLVGCGCFLGGLVRGVSEMAMGPLISSAFAILCVNVLGCFIVGILTGSVLRTTVSTHIKNFSVTGFCGGLTTFSSFADGILKLFIAGHILEGVCYIGANMILGLVAVHAGLRLVLGENLYERLSDQ